MRKGRIDIQKTGQKESEGHKLLKIVLIMIYLVTAGGSSYYWNGTQTFHKGKKNRIYQFGSKRRMCHQSIDDTTLIEDMQASVRKFKEHR